ncbi:MAG: exopolyphosphatase [Xanthobacteraceae bacterium]|nr:MAG: exopolyphosphatase [Xanthobacteraceae bacterium]
MESLSRNRRPAASRGAPNASSRHSRAGARAGTRRNENACTHAPVAVIDIGSNSVRLVVYEELVRSLSPVFNEKMMCGLGREVHTTGLLAEDAVRKALAALTRFRALCRLMKVNRVYALATAACRDARNGPEFIAHAERILGLPIEVLSGPREAYLSALGVASGIYEPDGIVGDLGGGSLELTDIHGHRLGKGLTLPLGGLTLQDLSRRSPKRAEKMVKAAFSGLALLHGCHGRTFYAVGGAWRALARLHMTQSGYPLHVMHGYAIAAKDALAFVRRVRRYAPRGVLADIEIVAEMRRPLLAYAALVLEYIIRIGRPKTVVISAYGVREGLLFSHLANDEKTHDGLIDAAHSLNQLRSRSPHHGEELIDWTDQFVRAVKLKESAEEKRLRHAACLMADIGWRAHPDYRGEQSLNLIANGNFGAITHQGRAFLALTIYYRYAGITGEGLSPELLALVPRRLAERARILATVLRIGHLVSAAQPGVLPATHFHVKANRLILAFEHKAAALMGERVFNRLRQLARLMGRSAALETA